MRWLKHTISIILLFVAVGVFAAIGFSNHSDDYGRVFLPQGGTVQLPEGKVTVFDRFRGDTSQIEQRTAGLAFQIVPVGGGSPIGMTLDNGDTSELQLQRSETIGEFGALAKVDVPASGDYVVSGSSDLAPGAVYLEFGTNAGSALLQRWKLLAGLVLAALLLAIIPVPRSGRRRQDATDSTWSSDPRAPYAG